MTERSGGPGAGPRRQGCDGEILLQALGRGVAELARRVDEVDRLNVFPVPDGDTGSNMLATARAALAEGGRVPAEERTMARVAAAIAFGALMGARGNSGVILSQVMRGMADGLEGRPRFAGPEVAEALRRGAQAAQAALARPVDGTVVTVVRDAAAAAEDELSSSREVGDVLRAAALEAERSVERTPTLLPVLAEAGVVDAGGRGFQILLQAAADALGDPLAAPAAHAARDGATPTAPRPDAAEAAFGYETMFLVSARNGPLDPPRIREHLATIGESVLVAGDGRMVKVHVHSARPDEVIGYGLSLGALSQVSVENLDQQSREALEARAHGWAGAPVALEPVAATAGQPVPVQLSRGILAVVPGPGLARIMESVGATRTILGGAGANPSAGELLGAIERMPTDHVVLLPNHPNVELAARQAAGLSSAKRVDVVATRNPAEGIAALLAHDPDADPEAAGRSMAAAAAGLVSLQVTRAVRDATIAGRPIRSGQSLVLDREETLLAVADAPIEALLEALRELGGRYELVTVYAGRDAPADEQEQLRRQLAATFPAAAVEMHQGGQPHDRYLLALE